MLAILSLAASTLPASDGWKDLTGEPAPVLEASRWFNTDGTLPSLEELRGKFVLLEFFATW